MSQIDQIQDADTKITILWAKYINSIIK